MIIRAAKVLELITRERESGVVSRHATLSVDGVDTTYVITADEYHALQRARAKGANLVFSIAEEPVQ